MIKLVSDTINKNDINALIKWLGADEIPRLTKGSLTLELEKKWAEKIGTKYSIFVNSGSSAILLTLAALKYTGKLKNNKIIAPAVSWATDVSSPMLLGFETILCDCNLEDLSCDIPLLETIFIQENPSVFILVSVLGLVPDMDKIVSLCEKYDVILIEDNCESMGSKYNGTNLGNFGFASLFSTYFGHHISTIEGGFINTNDDDFYDSLLMMRSHGWIRDLSNKEKFNDRNEFDSLYTFYLPGLNVRSTDIQAFIGLRSIEKLDEFSEKRNKNFMLYHKLVKNTELSLTIRDDDFISNFAYPIITPHKNKIVKELQENNVEVRPLIAGNMAIQPFWVENKPNGNGYLTRNATRVDNLGFYVPNHQELTENDIKKITTIINKYNE